MQNEHNKTDKQQINLLNTEIFVYMLTYEYLKKKCFHIKQKIKTKTLMISPLQMKKTQPSN